MDTSNAIATINMVLWEIDLQNMSSNKNKSSAIKLGQQIKMYKPEIKKRRTVTKSENNVNGLLITSEMGDNIVLSLLQKSKSHISHISSDIVKR